MGCFGSLVFILLVLVVSSSSMCSEYDFPCEDGECIDSTLWCDSFEDCSDGTDEKYCKESELHDKDPNKCPLSYYKCENGQCIPKIGRCDGYTNCRDSSDEKKCTSLDSTSEGSITSQPSKHSTSSIARTTTETPKMSSTSSYQPPRKSESSFVDSTYAVHQSEETVYSDLKPSDYSWQREKARRWLLSQRKSDFGWEDETPRALTALLLSDVQRSNQKNETDMLMEKQLEVQLSLAMARNGTKAMQLTDLALYINALLASCKNPRNFYGENLIAALRNGVISARNAGTFVNPSVYLTLCINKDTTYEDVRYLLNMHTTQNVVIARNDIQVLVLLTTTCIYRNTNFLTSSTYDGFRKPFIQRLQTSGFSGNVYEALLLSQILHEMKITQPGLLEFILKQQHEDGSFGGILATYLALPVLSGRSFLQMSTHCSQKYTTDLAPIEVLKSSKSRKIFVQYALNYGDPPEVTQTIQMKVSEGIDFLNVMRLAAEINPSFRFLLDDNRDVPVVYSIGGIPNDAEKGMFWTLYLASNNPTNRDSGRLIQFKENMKELIPQPGNEFVFWIKSVY